MAHSTVIHVSDKKEPERNRQIKRNDPAEKYEVRDEMHLIDVDFKLDSVHFANNLISEIDQIYNEAQKEAMIIFENAKIKTKHIIQKSVGNSYLVDCGSEEQFEFSPDNMTACDIRSKLAEMLTPRNRTEQTSESSENNKLECVRENNEFTLEEVVKDNLERYGSYIADCVKVTDLIAFFSPLTSAQTKELRCLYKMNTFEATKRALEFIKTMPNTQNKYTLFLEALEDAGYPKIVRILDGTLIPVGSYHRDIIRQCAKHIFRCLNTSEILPYLFSTGVINNEDVQQILQTERTVSTGIAALELLDILPNRNKRWFKFFIESLVKSGHADIANLIKDNTSNYKNPHETSGNNSKCSSHLDCAGNQNDETLHPILPVGEPRQHMRRSSSGGRCTNNGTNVNKNHQDNDEDNKRMAPILSKFVSPRSETTESSGDVSCVQAVPGLDSVLDHSHTKHNDIKQKPETVYATIPKPKIPSSDSTFDRRGRNTAKPNSDRDVNTFHYSNGAFHTSYQRRLFHSNRNDLRLGPVQTGLNPH